MEPRVSMVIALLSLSVWLTGIVTAQVPQLINYQGRVTVGGTNVTGNYNFRFALVNTTGAVTYWSNGTSSVSLSVNKGLYSVLLGDTSVPNMAALPASVFTNSDVRLRVWFDGGSGLQQLSPDQRIAAVGYAMMAGNVPDGAITSNKLAAGAVGTSQLASNLANAIVPWQVAGGTQIQAAPNTGYILTNAVQNLVWLPLAANVGDVIRVSGIGTGGWTVGYGYRHESNRAWTFAASSADGMKLVAVAYNDKIYTSSNGGETWTPRESNREWRSVASSNDGTKLVAVANDDRIYTSTDSGVTWTTREDVRWWRAVASSADGTKLVAACWPGQIYTSSNAGTNWTARESSRSWSAVASSADGSKLVAVEYGGQIYTSSDSGATWTPRESNRNWTAVASSADGTKLVAVVDGGQIYTSSDAGTNWVARESNRAWRGVANSADGTRVIAVDRSGQISMSSDSGVTWTTSAGSQSWSGVACSADGIKLVAICDPGQIYTFSPSLTGAAGTTAAFQYLGNGVWQPLNEALVGTGAVGSTQLANNAVQAAHLATGSVTSNALSAASVTSVHLAPSAVTSNAIAVGAVGAAQLATGTVGTTHLSAAIANAVVPWQVNGSATPLASANTGYILTNNAATELWLPSSANIGDVVRVSGVGTGGWQIVPNIGQTISGYSGTLSFGETWTARTPGKSWRGLAASSNGTTLVGTIWYGGGGVWVSHDMGTNWTERLSGISCMSAACSADGRIILVCSVYGQLYVSTDGGTNWVARGPSVGWNSVACSTNGSRMAATTAGGQRIYVSADGGTNWTAYGSSRSWIGIACSADGTKLLATSLDATNNTSIYAISQDAGTNWTEALIPRSLTNAAYLARVAMSADGRLVAVADDSGRLHISRDGGTSWFERGHSNGWRRVSCSADGNKLLAGSKNGFLYVSTDTGDTWHPRELLGDWHATAMSADGKVMAAGKDLGSVYISQNQLTGPTVAGAQNTTAALQYLGNGVWQPLNEALVGTGAVGSTQLANNAVQAAHLATGAVTSNAIAAGSVDNSKLVNSTVTINAGDGLTGGGPVALGGSVTLHNAGVLSVVGVGNIASSGGQNPQISLTGVIPSLHISGVYSNAVSFTNPTNSFTGTFTGNGAGLTNVPTPTLANYVFAYDTNTQRCASVDVFQPVSFSTNTHLSGWNHQNTNFVCSTTGLYLVQYHATVLLAVEKSCVSLRLTVNGTEVPGSQASVGPTNDSSDRILPIAKAVLVTANANDVLRLEFAVSDTHDALLPDNGHGDTRPSATITIIRIQ